MVAAESPDNSGCAMSVMVVIATNNVSNNLSRGMGSNPCNFFISDKKVTRVTHGASITSSPDVHFTMYRRVGLLTENRGGAPFTKSSGGPTKKFSELFDFLTVLEGSGEVVVNTSVFVVRDPRTVVLPVLKVSFRP